MVLPTSDVIILYDIPTNDPKHKAWSPNTWKARFALNYKGIPYKTEWVEYPDIEPLYHKLGATAPSTKRSNGRPHYSLPLIYDPATQRVVPDSHAIVAYLDSTYPATPALLPPGTAPLQAAGLAALESAVGYPLYMLVIARTNALLAPRSAEYHRRTSEAAFGNKLEALGGPAEWGKLEAGLRAVDSWLSANGPGRDELFMGEEVCFCDLQLAAYLHWARLLFGEDSDAWKSIAEVNGGKWKRIAEAFDKYAAVDA